MWWSRLHLITIALAAIGWIVAVTFSVSEASRYSWLLWLDHWSADWRTSLLSDRPKGQHPSVAIVAITEDTLDRFTYRVPVDRGFLARLVTRLDGNGARAIGLDFLFIRPTEPAKDEALIAAIRSAKTRVVVAIGDNRVGLNPAQTAYQKQFLERSGAVPGFANLLTENDRIVRYVAPPEDPAYPKSFAVALAKPDAAATEGPRRISWLLRPSSGDDRFLTLAAQLLVAPAGAPENPAAPALLNLLRGKTILVGARLPDLDRHQTPLARWQNDDEMPGVNIHAQVVAQLLDGRNVTRVDDNVFLAILAVMGLTGTWLGLRYGFVGYTVYSGTATLLLAVADAALFAVNRQFVPFGACVLALVAGLAGGIVLRRFRP